MHRFFITLALTGFTFLGPILAQSQSDSSDRSKQLRDWAQSSFVYLTRSGVAEDLKLTKEQVEIAQKATNHLIGASKRLGLKGKELADALPKVRQEARDMVKPVIDQMSDKQLNRYLQIHWQIQGPLYQEAKKRLNITPAQEKALYKVFGEETARGNAIIVQKYQFMSPGYIAAQAALKKTVRQAMINALSKEQQSQWKKMTGEPFHGDVSW